MLGVLDTVPAEEGVIYGLMQTHTLMPGDNMTRSRVVWFEDIHT